MNQSKEDLNYYYLFKKLVYMKKILFVAVCLLIVSVTALAQQRGGTPEETTKRTMEWMTTELKLSTQQLAQVEPILLAMAKERTAFVEKANGDFGSVRDDMQKINAKAEEDLAKILSKEQMEEYRKQMTQRRGGGGGGNR